MSQQPSKLVSAFIRQAVAQGGVSALVSLQAGVWTKNITQNGRKLVSASVNGETVNFSFDPDMTTGSIMELCESAIKWMTVHTDEEIKFMLDGRLPNAVRPAHVKDIF
jgi:hypothetical protein